MSFDSEMVDLAYEILQEFGKNAVYTVLATGTYTPSTSTIAGQTATTYNIKIGPPGNYGKFADLINKMGFREFLERDETQIGIASKELTLASAPVPVIGHLITFNSTTWTVTRIERIYSGESVALFILSISEIQTNFAQPVNS